MLELRFGFISDEDMADWCGKELKNYKNKRTRWFRTVLVKYAKFNVVPGGVEILEIYDPIFNPSLKKEVGDKWEQYWGYEPNVYLDTNTACWNKLKKHLTFTKEPKDSTGKSYISRCKCEDYGVARRDKQRRGKNGYCKYTYCVVIDGVPHHFSQKDIEVKAKLEDEFLKPTYKGQKYEMRALYVDYKRGDLSQREYEEALNGVVEKDLGWEEFENVLNEYLKEEYGETAHADFYQELVKDRNKSRGEEPIDMSFFQEIEGE